MDGKKTAPDYSVEEDEYGRLINRDKFLIWPNTQPMNKHTFEKMLKSAPPEVPIISPALTSNSGVTNLTRNDIKNRFSPNSVCNRTSDEMVAASKIGSTTFILYYQLNDNTINEHTALFMAYKNNLGKVYHFPLKRRNVAKLDEAESLYWRVDYGDPNPKEFHCLSALVRYYQIFSYYDCNTGRIEAFPLWTGGIIDCYE
uniref:SH2 domain-containing protein n=1 Tax=Heterorhabditis bacteriophora TaxID=37862 RepID=A0A1I7WRR4_HETBA